MPEVGIMSNRIMVVLIKTQKLCIQSNRRGFDRLYCRTRGVM